MIRTTRKGFTLVEIMIVVAIIGILIAIAVPGFLKARETSRLNACQGNMQRIDSAIQQLIIEENYEDQAAAVGAVDLADLVGDDNYIRFTPVCPSGGTYTLQEEGYAVTCDALNGAHNAGLGDDDDE